jgi:predicted Zn-dependent protease with MMP-like domain
MVSDDVFDQWVDDAVESLPPYFKDRIDNVIFAVEDKPDPDDLEPDHPDDVLGLYIGIPLPERSVFEEHFALPDVIIVYKDNIEAISDDEAEIKRQIYETVFHEIGHYFGMSESAMDAIEAEWAKE